MERKVKKVSENETALRMRQNAVEVMECLEAFRVAFEDGIQINPVPAQEELQKALNAAHAIFVDTFGDEQEHDAGWKLTPWQDLTDEQRKAWGEARQRDIDNGGHASDWDVN